MNELRERLEARRAALTAAGFFDPNKHPRGQGGEYIEVGGTVQITDRNKKPISEGRVTAINNGVVTVRDNKTGTVTQVSPASIKQAPVREATIHLPGGNVSANTVAGNRATAANHAGGRQNIDNSSRATTHYTREDLTTTSKLFTPEQRAIAHSAGARDAQTGKKPKMLTDPRAAQEYMLAYNREHRRLVAAKRHAAVVAHRVARHKAAMKRKAARKALAARKHAAVLARRAAAKKAAAARKAATAAKANTPKYHKYTPSKPVGKYTSGKHVNLG